MKQTPLEEKPDDLRTGVPSHVSEVSAFVAVETET